jgi:hypothetical protein
MAGLKKSEACVDCHEQAVLVKRKRRFERCEDCRRAHTILMLRVRKVSRQLRDYVGLLISYNQSDGWRAGYLVSFNSGRTAASVQPIGSINSPAPDIIAVRVADMRPEPCQSKRYPRIEDYYAMTDKAKKKPFPVLVTQRSGVVQPSVAIAACKALAVQEIPVSTEPEQPRNLNKDVAEILARTPVGSAPTPVDGAPVTRKSHHAPFDAAEAVRLYVAGHRMRDIIEAVRGDRATGATGNLVREACRAAGVYKEPVK